MGATLVRPMSPPSTYLVVATGLGLTSRIFGPCATLAALARSGDGEPNSTARGLDKSFDPACMTPPAVPSCAMKRVPFAAQWGVH